jgi:ATP-dependent Lon protease
MSDKTNSAKTIMKLRNGKKYEVSKKRIVSSDDDSSSWIDDESCEEEEEFDMKEFRGMLSNLFPSNYINEKTKNTHSKKSSGDDKKEAKIPENLKTLDKYYSNKKMVRKDGRSMTSPKPGVKKFKKVESSSSEETEGDDEEDEEYYKKGNGLGKINIIFTMGGNEDEYDDEDYEDECECEEDECECEYSCEEDEDEAEEESEEEDNEDDESEKEDDKHSKMSNEQILSTFKEMTSKLIKSGNKDNAIVKHVSKLTKEIEEEETRKQEKLVNGKKRKHLKQFKKMLRSNSAMNDVTFFKEKLTVDEQKLILKEMESVHNLTKIEKPYRLTVLESNIPTRFKSCALRRLNQLRYMEPGSGEYYKIKNWIDTFMQIPFGKYNNLPVTLTDGVEKCHDFMDNAKNCLDEEVFGLNDAKMQIMQMIGQWIANPDAVGSAIAIQGPMGTGKTTLIKDGISKILNREFAFIALGGATDSSFLEGHSYTYEGSTWGKIVDILIQCKSMNPIIYFDELDKVSDTPKGEEIIGILTHLTDTSQNSKFHDKYFSEIDFDLSKCLFIFSYNDESKVNPILKDRMYRIHTAGYNKNEKTTIANDYLLPKIMEQVKFDNGQINIPDETIQYVVDNFTHEENGVRNLKRCLEIIYTKLNLYRLMKPGTNLFEEDMSLKIEFPLTVTVDIVNKLIKKDSKSTVPYGMYT